MYITVRRHQVGTRLELRPVKVTHRPPSVVDADEVVVKVRLDVPDAAFSPLDGGRVTVNHTVRTAEVAPA